jgi:hypothetical protein
MRPPDTPRAYRVFVQRELPTVDLVGLLATAKKWYPVSIEVLADQDAANVRVKAGASTFGISARPTTEADLELARTAEERGRAAGMAGLAARCKTLWEITAESGATEADTLRLCAVIASTGLGPVLPPDASTLFGVRGAMERVEKLGSGLV